MTFDFGFWVFGVRWLHVLSGVMWIGLLWYFNFVQMPSMPKIPEFPGAADFKGITVHTERYPREGLDLAGKKVGVVGCGATGIQVIQTIASQVSELTVFQRTPSYGVPMNNHAFDDAERNHWRAKVPELRQRVNETFTGFAFDFDNGSWYDLTPRCAPRV